jgi:hypothetical protein
MTTDNNQSDPNFDNSKVYVNRSRTTGRGVFAKDKIIKGDLIERFPILPLEFRTKYQFDQGVIHHSIIKDSCQCADCAKHGYVMYYAHGFGSLYGATNKNDANAEYHIFYDNFYGEIIATQDIDKNQEILTDIEMSYMYKQFKMNQHKYTETVK